MTKKQNQFNISTDDHQNDCAYFAVSSNGYSTTPLNTEELRCVQVI